MILPNIKNGFSSQDFALFAAERTTCLKVVSGHYATITKKIYYLFDWNISGRAIYANTIIELVIFNITILLFTSIISNSYLKKISILLDF